MTTAPHLAIRHAGMADTDAARSVLIEAALWLRSIGNPLWQPDEFTRGFVEDAVRRNEAVIGLRVNEVVSFMLLQSRDDIFWPEDDPNDALYVHKLCVRRPFAGTGISGAMLQWAAKQAFTRGCHAVKLDCDPRPKLMKVYEDAGFVRIDSRPYRHASFSVWRYRRAVVPLNRP